MEIAFENLIQLQKIDAELTKTSNFLNNIPLQIEDIDNKIEESFKAVSQAKDELAANQKKRRELEAEVQDIKPLITKYKRQLKEVKTNKEYTSLLLEIDATEKKADALEDEIISEMLRADDIEEEIKAASLKANEAKEKFTKEKEILFRKKSEQEELKKKLSQQRDEILPKIPSDQLVMYETISEKNSGIALSPVTGEFCSMCHMRIRPQVLNELKAAKSIILCENCGRILHF
ncbi:MAG: C4-type zinc ribbon domain-containing protein [Candidatus Aminicenantes bacterium]